ncbi:RNA polymerase sigma-70 factor (ECF subfamily) [Paenibacillus shirakamiensis]|uniref:RNA polymerase sigma-70 factor (ECF subfamily) n=1 Tax=Paenibacillus shirakamiensis TaxID=1265935 RepID=A0ABS4JKM8_9BACL|nr:sigma-70 family RNA polymerase sigma factor [Paenibacillus shirakamiensis]MBP2002248.1 RNA polymerase sigma-70 factor (ECF subfamily) [Paenibacillus shirakamiensis]
MEIIQIDKKQQLEYLVNKYGDMVLRVALTHLRNLTDAQDVCQEVYIKLMKHQNGFNDAEHEKAWIIRVTINTCKDITKSPWRSWLTPLEEIPLTDNHLEDNEIISIVLTLPRKYRIVIYLYYYEGYKTTEIGKILNLKENTIRTQLRRAKETLKFKLNGGFGDDD